MEKISPVLPTEEVAVNEQLQTDTPPAPEEYLEISLLLNSVLYFIESVMIVKRGETYRLLAIHRGRVMADSIYNSYKGAKIAFLRVFGYKAWSESLSPDWTRFYRPDQKWLRKKINKSKRFKFSSETKEIVSTGDTTQCINLISKARK